MASWFPCAQFFALPTPTADSFHKNIWTFGFRSKQNLNCEALKITPAFFLVFFSLPSILITVCNTAGQTPEQPKVPSHLRPHCSITKFKKKKKRDRIILATAFQQTLPGAMHTHFWLTQTWASISAAFNTDLGTALYDLHSKKKIRSIPTKFSSPSVTQCSESFSFFAEIMRFHSKILAFFLNISSSIMEKWHQRKHTCFFRCKSKHKAKLVEK